MLVCPHPNSSSAHFKNCGFLPRPNLLRHFASIRPISTKLLVIRSDNARILVASSERDVSMVDRLVFDLGMANSICVRTRNADALQDGWTTSIRLRIRCGCAFPDGWTGA